jgi:hypothetical protein
VSGGRDFLHVAEQGQVTISLDMRESAGLTPRTDVDFKIEAGAVRSVKVNQERRPQDRRPKARAFAA